MKKQQGFSIVSVLLIVVVLGLICGTGWYVWQARKPKTTATKAAAANPAPAPTPAPPPAATDETSSWLTFQPKSKVYAVKLPDGWKFFHQNDACDCLYSADGDAAQTYKVGTRAVVTPIQGGRDGVVGYSIFVNDLPKEAEQFVGFEKVGEFKTAGLTGTKYSRLQTDDAEGPDSVGKGGKVYEYYFVKGNKTITVTYSVPAGKPDNVAMVEKSLKTLK
jgi:hypothetical protein